MTVNKNVASIDIEIIQANNVIPTGLEWRRYPCIPFKRVALLDICPVKGKHKLHFCLDADRAGRNATRKISEILRSSYKTVDCSPPMGKDYNDFLLLTQRQCLGEER